MSNYHPEPYWTEVAERIESREGRNLIAGDDEPFYRYKRERFLKMLHSIDFEGKSVLEIGSGPGGNLKEILTRNPKKLSAADISSAMIKLASENTNGKVDIKKTNGTELPFSDGEFDVVFSATVLQHNTDEKMMETLLAEMCRVSSDRVFLFEKVDGNLSGDDLCKARPVGHYTKLVNAHGFELVNTSYINIRTSYYVCGALRKGLNPKTREEGQPLTKVSLALQNLSLPFTKVLDKIFVSKKDVAKMEFQRVSK